jgi:hypothetical protein
MRRLLLLLSVGWLPPSLRPSGACLCLGSSVLYQPQNAICQLPTIFTLAALGVCWGLQSPQQPQEQPVNKGVGYE